MGIKVGDPELTFLGNAQIIQSVSDIGVYRLPEKSGIGAAQVLRIAIPDATVSPIIDSMIRMSAIPNQCRRGA
jgi:hypothetical protein